MKYTNVEDLTDAELLDALYDWRCMMAEAFNGTRLPSDFPRRSLKDGGYRLNGKHLAFYQMHDYVVGRVDEHTTRIV